MHKIWVFLGWTGLFWVMHYTMDNQVPGLSTSRAAGSSVVFDLQGHRGARGLLPENSIPGFIRALELGVHTLEMDVVVSKDAQVVVSHDPWFSSVICSLPNGDPVPPTQEQDYRLYGMTYEQIARFDCGSRGHPRFPRQEKMRVTKPLLREVIAAAEAYAETHGLPPVRYNIETKSLPEGDGLLHPVPPVFTRLLYDILVETGIRGRTTVQSFDVRTLREARSLDPALTLSLLIGREEDRGLAANLATLGFTPAIYSPDYTLVDSTLLAAAHAAGLQVIPWTVNTRAEMNRLRDLGVDGLITDYPDIGRQLLE